jgi:hypothetical protein
MNQTWQARILPGPPLIAPARQIVLPQAVPGEEDALARGALWLDIKPANAGNFLAQCALGFAGLGVATGVWPTPDPDALLAMAGGYGYRIDTTAPDQSRLLPLRPVVSVHPTPNALVLTGFHTLYILEANTEWESRRLSWEGLTITSIEDNKVHGTGWHMRTDRELPFTLNLATHELTGGAFHP